MPRDVPMVWRVQVATAGLSRNGTHYPLDVLQRCAGTYDCVTVRFHPTRRDHRIGDDLTAWVGMLRSPRPNERGVEAVLHIFPHRQDVARMLAEAWHQALGIGLYPLSFSHVLDHSGVSLVTPAETGQPTVWDIRSVRAVDLVTYPAMRGTVILGPASEQETSMFQKTPNRADIESSIRAEIDQLFQAEQELEERRHALEHEIAPVARASGDAVLHAMLHGGGMDGSTQALQRNGMLKAELDGVTAAIDVARTKRRAAIERLWKAQAETTRQQAKQLRAGADELQAKIEKILDQAADLAGSPFVPKYAADQALLRSGGHVDGHADIPIPGRMRQEAATLESSAANLEKKRVAQQRGTIRATSVDDLLDQVMRNALEVAPTLSDVRQWALSTPLPDLGATASGQGRDVTTAPITPETQYSYTLNWRDGQIDLKASSKTRRTPASVRAVA